jgi:hypothetical protein
LKLVQADGLADIELQQHQHGPAQHGLIGLGSNSRHRGFILNLNRCVVPFFLGFDIRSPALARGSLAPSQPGVFDLVPKVGRKNELHPRIGPGNDQLQGHSV